MWASQWYSIADMAHFFSNRSLVWSPTMRTWLPAVRDQGRAGARGGFTGGRHGGGTCAQWADKHTPHNSSSQEGRRRWLLTRRVEDAAVVEGEAHVVAELIHVVVAPPINLGCSRSRAQWDGEWTATAAGPACTGQQQSQATDTISTTSRGWPAAKAAVSLCRCTGDKPRLHSPALLTLDGAQIHGVLNDLVVLGHVALLQANGGHGAVQGPGSAPTLGVSGQASSAAASRASQRRRQQAPAPAAQHTAPSTHPHGLAKVDLGLLVLQQVLDDLAAVHPNLRQVGAEQVGAGGCRWVLAQLRQEPGAAAAATSSVQAMPS